MNNSAWMLDAHCDTLYHQYLFKNKFDLSKDTIYYPKEILDKISIIFNETVPTAGDYPCHVTLSRLRQGNIGAIFMNVGDMDLEASRTMLNYLNELAKSDSAKIKICSNAASVQSAVASNHLAIIPIIEGMLMFHNNLDLLHEWNSYGVKVANLTHGEGTEGICNLAKIIYGNNAESYSKFALQKTPSTERFMPIKERNNLYKNEHGLTDFGKEALKEMENLGMVCDLAHANDATFWQAIERTNGKFCVTHSNCAALCNHSRNLTDDMMKALAGAGGVMGLCFFGDFIDPQKPSLNKFVDHIQHALEVMGPDRVGIGSDYDGVQPDAFMAIPQPDLMSKLWLALEKAGVDKTTIVKIAHENFLKLLN